MQNVNVILAERSRHHYWRGAGSLSIKTFSGGAAFYDIGHGAFLVDDQSYLLLNHGQEYAITIQAESEVTSFCVFFADGFAEEVYRNLSSRPETLLDDPAGQKSTPLHFFERTYAYDDQLSAILNDMRAARSHHQHEATWQDEQFHRLMHQLLRVHERTSRQAEQFPALRVATRQELYRRLHLAHDYIAACFDQPLCLDDIAQIACMSPNHLLRTFKKAFGQTPHQFLTDTRLRHARRLLVTTSYPVTDICLQVGFTSLGSFSWLFRQRFGLSPQAFRLLNAPSQNQLSERE